MRQKTGGVPDRLTPPVLFCHACSGFDKGEEIRIDLVFKRRAHAVRRAGIDLELRVFDQLRGQHGGGADRDDLIVVAMEDQCRDVDFLAVGGEIRFRERLDAEIGAGKPHIMPCSQNDSRTPSETLAPGLL